MSARPRRAFSEPEEEHADERWMASYMDMVTVLMCLFIVLFAISSVDADKFKELSVSLATGFGATPSETVDTASGLVVPPSLVGEDGEVTALLTEARAEIDRLEIIKERINSGLTDQGLQNAVRYEITERGLIVRLIGAETFFSGNSVDLTPMAVGVLGSTGSVLATIPQEITIEGHADPRGSSLPFATDWELSSGRATQVVRYLVESSGISGGRIGAVGFGSARPLAADSNLASIALNRRVDIVILSDASEDVRALIPDVIERGDQPVAEPTLDAVPALENTSTEH